MASASNSTNYPLQPHCGVPAGVSPSATARLDALLLRFVDAGLVAAVFFVPLVMGGRVALGQVVLVAAAIWGSTCWCLRQSLRARAAWIRSPADLLLPAALVLVGFQLVALPPSVLEVLCPRSAEILPLWGTGADGPTLGTPTLGTPTLGTWNTLSLAPIATRQTLILLLAFVLLFFTTMQRVQRIEDVERLIRWMAISTVAMAVFGLAQYLASNGKYFWFFEYPLAGTSANLTGSFTNRNHFAQFIALGIGPLVWWVMDAVQTSRRRTRQSRFGRSSNRLNVEVGLRGIALVVASFAGLLTLSRGGALAMSVAALVTMLILYRGSLTNGKSVLAVLAVGLLVVICLGVYGYEAVTSRLDDLGSIEDLDKYGLRQRLWQANLAAIADRPLTGTGLGSHREIIPIYFQTPPLFEGLEATHAENGYLQIASETGLPGLALALIGVGLCVYWCTTCLRLADSPKVFLCLAAIAPGLAASFLHSMVDFVWYVPGCMVAVVLFAACACRLRQMCDDRRDDTANRTWISRAAWLTVSGCLVVIGFSMLNNRLAACKAEPHWHHYLRSALSLAWNGKSPDLQSLELQAEELSRVVELQPDDSRAHCRLASVHLQIFNLPEDPDVLPIDVRQVREAALASRFESASAMQDWLKRAFGERCGHLHQALRHARQAAWLCTLQGHAYLCLAKLSFLDGPNSPAEAAYVDQALKVRPFDGSVLFAAGQEAVLAGDLDRAIALWKASFQAGSLYQDKLLSHLTPQVPASFIFETFQPDERALRCMERLYGKHKRPNELRVVRQRRSQVHENEAKRLEGRLATPHWVEAAKVYATLDDPSARLRCLRNAVSSDASHYQARRALGECLYAVNEYGEAEEHLTWCLRHEPDDKQLRALVESVVDRRLRMTSRPTAASQNGLDNRRVKLLK